ncbi:hypothetical protein T265_07538 [Opisthorchis viverrini]|uniref:Uncharacterized protein n=1 Tax=Opisthorchis viverrini TaxID=6198 RepID=A0A074ZC80_OPIVI|nr:hypothetical protein T265_07538 [Opisthorchis viverrini]KER24916.1 hypothetical protein T265_07538 [Opisthorchis viverrini]
MSSLHGERSANEALAALRMIRRNFSRITHKDLQMFYEAYHGVKQEWRELVSLMDTALCIEPAGELAIYSNTPGSLGIQRAYYVHELPGHFLADKYVKQNRPVSRVKCALEIQKH